MAANCKTLDYYNKYILEEDLKEEFQYFLTYNPE